MSSDVHKTFAGLTHDRRNAITKLPIIIKDLREFGYKEGDEIPYEDIEYVIMLTRGLDPRTIRKYFRLLVQLDYLVPTGAPLRSKRFITVRTKHNISTKEYSSDKGFEFYTFGPRAPRLYHETLNPKYVPPRNPPTKIHEGVKGRKNMCVSNRGGRGHVREVEVRKKEEEDCVTHTYFYNNVMKNKKATKKRQLTPREELILRLAKDPGG